MTTPQTEQESYTADEIVGILHDLGYKATLDHDEEGTAEIDTASQGYPWRVTLRGSEPFYRGMDLRLALPAMESRAALAERFNREYLDYKALTFHFPDLRYPHCVEVVSGVTFEGGVSPRYLRSQLESWAVDVSWIVDFFDEADV
jgi:hypothetical protein